MTTPYHVIDVPPSPPPDAYDIGRGQVLDVFTLFLIAMICLAIFPMFTQGAKHAKERDLEAIIRRQRRRSGETGPFVHLRFNGRSRHNH